jgi:hypothetical protein
VICCCAQGAGACPGEVMQATMNAEPGCAVGELGIRTVVVKVPLGGTSVACLLLDCRPLCLKAITYCRAG